MKSVFVPSYSCPQCQAWNTFAKKAIPQYKHLTQFFDSFLMHHQTNPKFKNVWILSNSGMFCMNEVGSRHAWSHSVSLSRRGLVLVSVQSESLLSTVWSVVRVRGGWLLSMFQIAQCVSVFFPHCLLVCCVHQPCVHSQSLHNKPNSFHSNCLCQVV